MYKIIADSCCDIPEDIREKADVTHVPLYITVGDRVFTDDKSLDTLELIRQMKACPTAPSTACPSPGDFADVMTGDSNVFAVTMSRHLSGTYQSAVAGQKIKSGGGKVHVFDSKSASAGQSLIVHLLSELIGQGLSFDAIVAKTEAFINSMDTFFVLESLDNLIKNGRMNRLVGQVASILGMRPIMGADDGKIAMVEKARGTKNAMSKLVAQVVGKVEALRAGGKAVKDTLVITHCNCAEKAHQLKADIMAKCPEIKNTLIASTGGISTVYANDGGIIIAY